VESELVEPPPRELPLPEPPLLEVVGPGSLESCRRCSTGRCGSSSSAELDPDEAVDEPADAGAGVVVAAAVESLLPELVLAVSVESLRFCSTGRFGSFEDPEDAVVLAVPLPVPESVESVLFCSTGRFGSFADEVLDGALVDEPVELESVESPRFCSTGRFESFGAADPVAPARCGPLPPLATTCGSGPAFFAATTTGSAAAGLKRP